MNYQPLGIFAFICLVALSAAAIVVYVTVLRRHLDVVNLALDKPALVAEASGFWSRLNAKLIGWKTVILAALATLSQALQPILNELLPQVAQLPWVQVFDTKVATWITIVCTLLIPMTHVAGLSHAAVAEPKDAG